MSLAIGVESSHVINDLVEHIQGIDEDGYDFICTPLFHPRLHRRVDKSYNGPLTRSDRILSHDLSWNNNIVGKISEWIDLTNPIARIRINAEQCFKQEVEWAFHLGVASILLSFPFNKLKNNYGFQDSKESKSSEVEVLDYLPNYTNYARCLNYFLLTSRNTKFWIRIPAQTNQDNDDDETNDDQRHIWKSWNKLRQLCEYHPKLGIALELSEDISNPYEFIDKWKGEPLECLILPISIFTTNKKGNPKLSRIHKKICYELFKYVDCVMVKGKSQHETNYKIYNQYIQHLCFEIPNLGYYHSAEAEWFDFLQSPLQPLMNNLESQVYETFEYDSIKYEKYYEAIKKALENWEVSSSSGIKKMEKIVNILSDKIDIDFDDNNKEEDNNNEDNAIVVMVVGAGRGPLVAATIRASEITNRNVRVYALDKNPNAVITLRNRIYEENWENVTVISDDMRDWEPPEKADILVSELLGSFGDNELSPECLDGAQRLLKSNGISIPKSYSSYLAPIMSTKLWNAVRLLNTLSIGKELSVSDARGMDPFLLSENLSNMETCYVTKMHRITMLDHEKKCWSFSHPNPLPPDERSNERYSNIKFKSSYDAVIHGFAGYFEMILYDDVVMTIVPHSEHFVESSTSWFPLYFPIRKPINVNKGDNIHVHLWRCVNDKQVWYEWALSAPESTSIHNPAGRSFWIGL